MDQRYMRAWSQNIWKPYAKNCVNSVQLLAYFACHKLSEFMNMAADISTYNELISGGYTGVLQPFHVVVW